MDQNKVLQEVRRLMGEGFEGDLYRKVVANVWGITEDAVTPDQRQEVKRLAFACLDECTLQPRIIDMTKG